MNLGEYFRKAAAFLTPVRTDKVVLDLNKFVKSINLTGGEYRHAPEFNEFTMMTCGIMPSVRSDAGFTRAFFADPRQIITITPARPEFSDQPAEEPWRLKSSAAILAHDHMISRWHRGLNVVVRGRMASLNEPNVLMAMQMRYTDKGELTVKRLYMPEFDDHRRLTGVQRVAVTAENVDRALNYMVLCREQMLTQGGALLNPRENLRRAAEMTAAKFPPPPAAPKP